MKDHLRSYKHGSLGIPPSCQHCTLERCPVHPLKNDKLIRERLTFLRLEPGETLFVQGMPVDGAYLVCRGVVERGLRLESGKVQLLQWALAADWLIEALWGGHDQHLTFAKAATPTLTAFVGKAELREWFQTHPELMLELLERTCREVSRLWQRLAFRSYASPQVQLAFAIQTLSELRSSNGNLSDKVDLDLPLNETKLSDFLGVSERSVARHLKRLESRDTVDYQRGRLSVLDRARLRRLAESN